MLMFKTFKAINMPYLKMLLRKKLNYLCLAICTLVCLVFVWFHHTLVDDVDRRNRLQIIDTLIKRKASNLTCKQPSLPVYSPEIMKFIKSIPPIDCSKSGIDWVKCRGSECVIQEEAKLRYGPIKCSFTDILRVNDFKLVDGKTSHSSEYYKLEKSDVVRVACNAPDAKWSATLTGIRLNNNIWDRSNWEDMSDTALKMNVLMLGFDSLSRNAFIRLLPKSYAYLTKTLNGIVLKGYNIVGDGTPQALIPLLTGKTELELPDTRSRLKNTNFVDIYPFIWNNYRDAGYVTGFYEDLPNVGTFSYRLKGFEHEPTDHYMRSYYLANLGEQGKWPKLCAGDTPKHKIMFTMIKDFFTTYQVKPKFLFAFHGELSHDDYNLISAADEDLLELLMDLNNSGALNNTILILMADHGHRFAELRNTIQGKQEERLPFFSFTFPQWFKTKHSRIYKNFKSNENKLCTPFDIYATLKEILEVQNIEVGDLSQRSISLFSKIPEERSCAHAYIEPHWCACLDWFYMDLAAPIIKRLGKALVDTINNYTNIHRDICAYLSIAQILWVTKSVPNENLLKFNKNADVDGFVADLTANTELESDLYQIKVLLVPGNSLFEASIRYYKEEDAMQLKLSDISRTNMYSDQARCVEKRLPHLRKYCYCKKDF